MLAAFAQPARADDISATARGVVRVVTIAFEGESVGDFGHGSGFAIAPDRIVTNAHVVELAARDPEHVVIGIVPSAGDKTFRGRVVAYDPARALAEIARSEEHTSELQSLMRSSSAVLCLKKQSSLIYTYDPH